MGFSMAEKAGERKMINKNILNEFLSISSTKWYWLGLLVLGVSLEMAALFYQHVLDYPPCVLCIHVRIWVLGIALVSLLALKIYKIKNGVLLLQVLMIVLSSGLLERSYQLLGTERGFVFSDCNMESGLPFWFALDNWFPAVFKVQAACGYTPELLFGITMAEALIVFSSLLLLISIIFFVNVLMKKITK